MAALSLTGITKVYPGDVRAVNDLSFDVRNGEFIVLVGPSGCGKTTTLRIIAGLEQVSSGTIRIDDRVVDNLAPQDRKVAMVFQNYALYPHMTVFQNLAFSLKQRRHERQQIHDRVREAAETLGISDLLQRRPHQLSGGQQQRVALGRTIVRSPDVFLFDEPLSNLDANMRNQMRREIKRLHATVQQTMIYVTHDQTEAMTMGDRIVVLKNGEVQQIADPRILYEQPANTFVATFFGTPTMNLFSGVLRSVGEQLCFQLDSIKIPVLSRGQKAFASHVDQPVVLGVRPEDIRVTDSADATLTATVQEIDWMGPIAFLHLRRDTSTFTTRVDPAHTYKKGQQIKLEVNRSRIHLFHAESGIPLK